MTARGEFRRGQAEAAPDALAPLFLILLAVAAFELLVLRTFTRVAIHIPALERLSEPYRVLTTAGRFSYYLSAVLLIVALPTIAVLLVRGQGVTGRVAGAATAGFVVLAALARLDAVNPVFVDAGTIAAVIVLAAVAAVAVGSPAMLGAFAVAFLAAGSHTMFQTAASQGMADIESGWLIFVAEAAALVFAAALGFSCRSVLSRRAWALAAAVGLVTFAMFIGNGSTVRILMLWNGGLGGHFPAVLYAVAAAGVAAGILGYLRSGRLLVAAGVALLFIGGIGLHSTYQSGLVVAGLGLLAWSVAASPVSLRGRRGHGSEPAG